MPALRQNICGRTQDILLSFCRWTSVRGLQHVVRSEHPVSRCIWGTFVMIMFIANVGIVALLLIRYNRNNTVESIRTFRGIDVEFPDLTVCNVDPVSTERIACLRNSDCFIYSYLLNNNSNHNPFSETAELINKYGSTDVINKMEDMRKVSVLYQLIGMRGAASLGHQLEDLIVSEFCEITTIENGGILRKRKCHDASVQINLVMNYRYFNCYTLTLMNSEISSSVVRLSLIMYLDMESALNCKPYCTHDYTDWAGGKVVVHPKSTYPNIERHAINLLPGASNQVLISETRERKLSMNKCVFDEGLELSIVYVDVNTKAFRRRKMKYTSELCVMLKIQHLTMKYCDCANFLLPVPGKLLLKFKSIMFCGDLSHSNVSARLNCSQQIKIEYIERLQQRCRISCKKVEYNFEMTELKWPQKPRILQYCKSLKNRTYYQRKFKIYEDIEIIAENEPLKAEMLLQNTDMFEKNFLQLDVNRPSHNILLSYNEHEEYSLPTLLSQIGGICSVFLSFTFVTVLEILELFFRVLFAMFKSDSPICHCNRKRNNDHIDSKSQINIHSDQTQCSNEKISVIEIDDSYNIHSNNLRY